MANIHATILHRFLHTIPTNTLHTRNHENIIKHPHTGRVQCALDFHKHMNSSRQRSVVKAAIALLRNLQCN